MILRKLLLLFFLLYPTYGFTIDKPIIFNIKVDSIKPDFGIFFSDTSELEGITLLPPRELSGPSKKLLPVKCIRSGREYMASYTNPMKCDRLEWTVSFISSDNLDLNISEQKNIFSKMKWWTLFEWNVIPRIKGISNINVCAHIHNEHNIKKCHRLPNTDEPPLILIWGDATAEFQQSGTSFSIYTDISGRVLVDDNNQKKLIRQYHYMIGLFAGSDASAENIDLAWVGINKHLRVLGGAAGATAFVSNYVIENGEIDTSGRNRLFWVSGHEIFHMVTPYLYSSWVSESLAHYFGYKSQAQYDHPLLKPTEEWKKKQSRMPNSEAGLYKAHNEVTRNNNMRYYGLFYVKGAAFWHELDMLLKLNNDSLDDYLPLLADSKGNDGKLSNEFIETISKIIGDKKVELLLSKYL
jgi:hypothetical protein